MKYIIPVLLFYSISCSSQSVSDLSYAKSQMVQESISKYSGSCPCPFNLMRNGRKCGRVSAYSRPGGASPLCYEKNISDEQAKNWLKSQK